MITPELAEKFATYYNLILEDDKAFGEDMSYSGRKSEKYWETEICALNNFALNSEYTAAYVQWVLAMEVQN